MTAFLSGEMKDTVELNPTGAYGIVVYAMNAAIAIHYC